MVNRRTNYSLHFWLFALLLVCALGAVNYLGMEHRVRMDLTGDRRYTISEGTKRILERLSGPVTVTYYVNSEPPAARINLEREVRDKLDELAEASEGKLEYEVVRISNEELASQAKELEEKHGIQLTVDVMTSGEEEKAATIGAQGFFSSLLVRYGTAEPKAVNGVYNLVNKDDNEREHRVDTLEFDIMFAVLQMKNTSTKPPLKQLLRTLKKPLYVQFHVSEQMPADNPGLGDAIWEALKSLESMGDGKVIAQRQDVPWGEYLYTLTEVQGIPARVRIPPAATEEPTVDPKNPPSLPVGPEGPDGDHDDAAESPEAGEAGDEETGEQPEAGETPADAPEAQPEQPETEPEQPEPAKPEPRRGPNFFYAIVQVLYGEDGLEGFQLDELRHERTADAVRDLIESRLWEILKDRTTLGILMPPAKELGFAARNRSPNPYEPLANYIRGGLGLDTTIVDLAAQKRIPDDLAVLVVFEPHRLSERELYEVDRYLAEGGNVTLLFQGWEFDPNISGLADAEIPLDRIPQPDYFREWMAHLGISFGEEMLFRSDGYNMSAIYSTPRGRQRFAPQPIGIPLAVKVGASDLDQSSPFSRQLAGLPLPLPVELKLDDTRLDELEIQRQEIVRLQGETYRYLPPTADWPALPRSLVFHPSEAEEDPEAEPGPNVRFQRTAGAPLVLAAMQGTFPSHWASRSKIVPAWSDGFAEDRLAGEKAPPVKAQPGQLVVSSCAASLNIDYINCWRQEDFRLVVTHGLALYRNVAEGAIYGEELVMLRTRSGTAPRISGRAERGDRILWYGLCIAGAPVLLLGMGLMRMSGRSRRRDEQSTDAGLTDGTDES